MEIKETTILVRDLVDGYRDSNADGLWLYFGQVVNRTKSSK